MDATVSRRLILAFVISLVIYAMACFSPIAWSPDGASLAFVNMRKEMGKDGEGKETARLDYELWTWNLQEGKGRVLAKIGDPEGVLGIPAFSPDGQRVAYIQAVHLGGKEEKNRGSRLSLCFIDVRSGNSSTAWSMEAQQALEKTMPFFGCPLSWAPDGKALVFEIARDSYLYDQATGKTVELRKNTLCPSWSPRDAQIAVIEFLGEDTIGEGRLILLSPQGAELKSLARVPVHLFNEEPVQGPAWRPDGKALAYLAEGAGEAMMSTLSVAGLDGSVQVLLREKGSILCPSWSPDGKQIAFLSLGKREDVPKGETFLPNRIKVFDLDSKTTRTILDGKLLALTPFSPVWSPDGKSIAVFGFDEKKGGTILILSADGQQRKALPL